MRSALCLTAVLSPSQNRSTGTDVLIVVISLEPNWADNPSVKIKYLTLSEHMSPILHRLQISMSSGSVWMISRVNWNAASMVIVRWQWRNASDVRSVDWTNAFAWASLEYCVLELTLQRSSLSLLLGMRKEWILSEEEWVVECSCENDKKWFCLLSALHVCLENGKNEVRSKRTVAVNSPTIIIRQKFLILKLNK